MTPNTDLTGRVAVITGAARGVGLALALQAAKRGMNVALFDEDERALAAALEQVRERHVAAAIAVQGDVVDRAAVRELARSSAAELGPPWLVCNNPGTGIEANLWGVVNGVQTFVPGMVKRGGGHIVNIVAPELFDVRGGAPCVAAAHALVGLSEELYRELDSMGSQVGVTLMCPALIETNITDVPACHKARRSVIGDIPRSSVSPDEIAQEIFAALATRRFRVFPDLSHRASPGAEGQPNRMSLGKRPIPISRLGGETSCHPSTPS
jgi:NAD(P)-dependent dehydrogenase (short-subunit alcohol dehydrogenase family)